MASLRDMMAADAVAGGVFLPTDSNGDPSGFNQIVYYYPKGNKGRKKTVNAVVDKAHLEGTREAQGDGVVMNRAEARSVRESLIIEVPIATGVSDSQHHTEVDLFKINNEIFAVKRILGEDDYMVSVLVVKRKDLEVRTLHRNG